MNRVSRSACILSVIISACVFGQMQNRGQDPPAQPPSPNVLEPLVFSRSDCDLNNDGQVDDKDLQEALHQTQAFQNFKEQLIEQVRQSSERRGFDLRYAKKDQLEKLAFQIVSMHVPAPVEGAPEADTYSHRVLTYWDQKDGSIMTVSVGDDVLEKIRQGAMVFALDHESQRWELIDDFSRGVFIRLKPREPSKANDG